MAQNNNEGDRLDDLVEGLDEFLQGRYSVTFYCPYSRNHSRMFNSGNVKSCIVWAFFFTVIHQMIGALRHDKGGSTYLPLQEPEMNIGRDGSFQKVLLDMNKPVIINNDFANFGENLDSQKETLNNMHASRKLPSYGENGEIAKGGEEDEGSYILCNMLYGFVRSYILFLFCIFSIFHLVPGFFSILHDMFVRHVVARNKRNPMLYGLFRFQRIRSRN